MRPYRFLPIAVSLSFAIAATGCSQDEGDESTTLATVPSVPSVHMQVRHDIRLTPAYEDMYLSRTISGVGSKIPLIRMVTKTLSNGVLVMQVTVKGGTLKDRVVWVRADQVEFKNREIAQAFEAQAKSLAQAAKRSGREAAAWQAAANAARLLCVTGVGANAALSVITLGAETVGKGALIALVGANTLTPILKCAGYNPVEWRL